MAGDLTKRNQNLYCQYHQEPRHTTEDCRNLKNHLDQQEQTNVETRRDTLRPPIGTINVILAAPRRTGSHPSREMLIARLPAEVNNRESKKAKWMASPMLGFLDEDKVRTSQPHNDALVVTLRIEGYDVKRVLVD